MMFGDGWDPFDPDETVIVRETPLRAAMAMSYLPQRSPRDKDIGLRDRDAAGRDPMSWPTIRGDKPYVSKAELDLD